MTIERTEDVNETCANKIYDLMAEYGVVVFLASLNEALSIWKKKVFEMSKDEARQFLGVTKKTE